MTDAEILMHALCNHYDDYGSAVEGGMCMLCCGVVHDDWQGLSRACVQLSAIMHEVAWALECQKHAMLSLFMDVQNQLEPCERCGTILCTGDLGVWCPNCALDETSSDH